MKHQKLVAHNKKTKIIPEATHPQSPRSQRLLARNRMNDGEVSLHADHYQDENRRGRTEAVHKLIHLAQKVAKDPTGKTDRQSQIQSESRPPRRAKARDIHSFNT